MNKTDTRLSIIRNRTPSRSRLGRCMCFTLGRRQAVRIELGHNLPAQGSSIGVHTAELKIVYLTKMCSLASGPVSLQRTLSIGGSITVHLTSCLTGLDLTKQVKRLFVPLKQSS